MAAEHGSTIEFVHQPPRQQQPTEIAAQKRRNRRQRVEGGTDGSAEKMGEETVWSFSEEMQRQRQARMVAGGVECRPNRGRDKGMVR